MMMLAGCIYNSHYTNTSKCGGVDLVNTNYARRGIYAPLYGVEYGAVECLVLVYTVLNARCTDNNGY